MMRRIITTIVFRASYFLFLLFSVGIGFPTDRSEKDSVLKLVPNETHYANGTVVGKYAYMDKEGNPVQVKYYADDSSYGVELSSVKVFDSKDFQKKPDSENPEGKSYQFDKLDQVEYNGHKNPAKETTYNKYDTKTDDEIKSTNIKSLYSPGYEIYKHKDDASNVQCGGNDKAYAYNFEAEPQKIHEPDIAEEESFCQLLY